jgi:ankyrin repeat protein
MAANKELSENENNVIEAIFKNDFEEFKRIIESSLDPNIINIVDHDCGSSLINFACSEGRLKFIEYLIEKGVDVNESCYGSTPFWAMCRGDLSFSDGIDITRLLIQNGAVLLEDDLEFFKEDENKILRDIMNENYFVKPCCKK